MWKIKERLRYALIEQDTENPLKHRGTFNSGALHVKHHATKEFVEHSYFVNPNFASRPDCKFFGQNAHIAFELYENETLFFDPDYERRICVERWIPQVRLGNNWRTIETIFTGSDLEILADGFKVTKYKDCLYNAVKVGELAISYIVRAGAFLKHEVSLKNLTTQTRTLRMVQTLIGIAGKRVIHALGEDEIRITEQERLSNFIQFVDRANPKFQYLHENLESLGHMEIIDEGTVDEEDVWVNDYLRGIRFKLVEHWGKQLVRCDIVIGNYRLNQNESLFIDPSTDTFYVGGVNDDAYERGDGTFYVNATNITGAIRSRTNPNTQYYRCSGWRYPNLTGINQGDTIVTCIPKIWTYTNDDPNCVIYAHDHDSAPDFSSVAHIISEANRPRTSAGVSWVATGVGVDQFVNCPESKTVLQEIVNRSGWSSGNALVLLYIANTDVDEKKTGTRFYDSSSSYAAQLYVEWTSGVIEKSVSDALSLSDSIVKHRYVAAIPDSAGLVDSIIRNKDLVMADAISLSDAIAKHRYVAAIADAVSLVDSIIRDRSLAVADTLSLVDTILKTRTFSVPDTLSLADVIRRDKTLPISDTMNLTDSIFRDKELTIADTIGLSDALIRNRIMTIADTISLADVITRSKLFSISDSLSLTDAIIRDKDLTIDDVMSLADTIVRDKSLLISDTIGLSDAIICTLLFIIADSISLSDAVLKHRYVAPIPDTVSLVDTIIRDKSLIVGDTTSLADTIIRDKDLIVSESFSLTDAILKSRLLSIGDTLSLADTILRDKDLTISETIALVDAITRDKDLILSDVLSLTDVIDKHRYVAPIPDSISAVDVALAHKTFLLAESITLADVILKHRYVAPIEDVLTLSDVILRHKLLTIADTISLADTIVRNKTLLLISDTASVVDTIFRDKSFAISDAITLTDDIAFQRYLTILETISLTETILKTRLINIPDAISLSDLVIYFGLLLGELNLMEKLGLLETREKLGSLEVKEKLGSLEVKEKLGSLEIIHG